MVGQGSVNHNSRAFNAKNTDPERSHLNITYCHENIKAVFHELFVAVVYLVLVMLFTWLLSKFERRMAQGDR